MALWHLRRTRNLVPATAAVIDLNAASRCRFGCASSDAASGLGSERNNDTHQKQQAGFLSYLGQREMHASSHGWCGPVPRREMLPPQRTHRQGRRSFSFYGDSNRQTTPNIGNPSYTVYGEEVAFSIKAIPPEFRALASGTVVLDSGKRGRFLFEWAPMDNSSGGDYGTGRKYRWDATTRFALTAEEAASLLARLDRGDPSVELSRRLAGDHYQNPTGMPVDKIFMAKLVELEDDDGGPDADGVGGEGGEEAGGMAKAAKKKNNGISLLVDYVDPDNQRLGQIPHPGSGGDGGDGGMFDASEGFRGPFEIRLMIGEYQVLRSILEYSIPRLVGWSTMFDRNIEQAINRSLQGGNNYRGGGGGGYRGPSPHNYQGSGDGGGGY